MPTISLKIPQIGEGLQEARLVATLKQPGDRVRRDEPIYQMETDKAVMDVESPYDGVLVEWIGKIDELLLIGADVALMAVDGPVDAELSEPSVAPSEAAAEPAKADDRARLAGIPPRTRAYAKEKGISDDQLAELAAGSPKLMPSDIDAFLGSAATPIGSNFEERPLGAKQKLLASRLVRSSQLVVPGTMTVVCRWSQVERQRERDKASGDHFTPSAFTMFAYAVALTLKEFPDFRSSLVGDDRVRTYKTATLGIAVGLPGDELVIAAVEDADTLAWRPFAERMREKIELARSGKDQASEAVTISLTNMQSFGLREAVPVAVAPSVATLFLGEVFIELDPRSDEMKSQRVVNLTLTFDHRLINGVGAANFLNAIKQRVETISSILN